MSQRYALNDGVCWWSSSLHLKVEAGVAGVRVRTLRRDDTNFGLETSVSRCSRMQRASWAKVLRAKEHAYRLARDKKSCTLE